MIDHITFWFLLLFGSLYAIIHLLLAIGSKRLFRSIHNSSPRAVSVIIAARNEERNISRTLESLSAQNYPEDKFEIIVVNDRSNDSTSSIVEKFRNDHPNVQSITIESNTSDMPHKKNALRAGIAQAKFDILAFTDADCVVGKEWLKCISNTFDDQAGVVAGYSPYAEKNPSSFLRYEENKNSLIAASAVELDHAYMCTGRNLSYRRSIFDSLGGFDKIKQSISGDDDLFIQLVQRETNWKIRYMITPESFVHTLPPDSFSHFVNQRTRHVSASSHYPFAIKSGYGIIHFFHLGILTALVLSPFYGLIALMVKFNIDGAFIARGRKIFLEEFGVPEFVLNELLLIAYSFFIAPLGFIRRFEWKESAHS